ncbi:hypothetical protein DV736_g5398, partial [Chaetothyriales sp. CBS 134916]
MTAATSTIREITFLRDQLIGAWQLMEYCAYLPSNESDKRYPQGPDATGILVYTPDGYMSAQLQTPGQQPFDVFKAADEDWAASGKNYLAYTGRFFLDEKGDDKGRPVLLHEMFVSSLPHLRGQIQRRVMDIAVDESDGGRYLVLSLDEPVNWYGDERLIRVRWRRLPDNQASSPPV